MANWLIRQTVDLAKGINARAQWAQDILPIAYPGDSRGHVWEVTVLKDGEPFALNGNTIAAYFFREGDQQTVPISASVTAGSNVAEVTLTQDVYAYEGRVTGIMRLVGNGSGPIVTIAACSFIVGADMTGAVITPSEPWADYNYVLNELERLEAANAAAENIVLVQDEQPDEAGNRIWIKTTDEEYVVPTWGEFEITQRDARKALLDSFGSITEPSHLKWESGSFASATGATTSNAAYIRCPDFIPALKGSTVSVSDLSAYRYQVMWYSTADVSGFDVDNSKAAGVREAYTVPADGYIRISIRDDSQSALADYAICSHFVLSVFTDETSVEDLRDTVLVDKYAALEAQAEIQGFSAFDASEIAWSTGGLSADGSFSTTRTNRVGIERFIACKKGSYIRLLDKSYQMTVCTYSGITTASKIEYTGYSQDDWVADRDCFVRLSMLKLDGPTINMSAAAEAVEIVMFGGGGSGTEHGTISVDDGTNVDATDRARVRTTDGIRMAAGTMIEAGSDFPFYIRLYSDEACTDYIDCADDLLYTYTASRACWARMVFVIADVYNLYSSDAITVTDAATDDVRINKIEGMVSIYDCLPITHAPGNIYQCADDIDGSLLPGVSHLSEDRLTTIYRWWHALYVEHTDCMTETALGTDASGTYDVMCYTIEAPRGKGGGVPDDRYEILWLSNIHGHERYCLTSTYWFFKNLVEKHVTDEHFAFLWAHCKFVVVPCVNPWGVANAKRYNSNNVDLNRNFDASWSYHADTGDGSSSRTADTYVAEAETTLMTTLINAHPNALFIVNRHDAGDVSASNPDAGYSWVKDAFDMDRRVLEGMFRQLRVSFLDHYACATSAVPAVIRNLASSSNAGTMDCWYNMIGMHGCLVESFCNSRGYRGGDTPVIDENAIDTLRMGVDMNVAIVEAVVTWANLIRACSDVSIVYTPSSDS